MKKVMKFIALSIILFIGLNFIEGKVAKRKIEKVRIENIARHERQVDSLLEQKALLKEQIIAETINYIDLNSKGAQTEVIANKIVEQSIEHRIGICFILAQCQIETVFGTKGIGRAQSKKSMFGVNKTYKNYEDCIEHYASVVRNNYLGDKKSIDDLMKNYVTLGGYRYAEDLNYERKLSKQYNKIINQTNINDLEIEYQNLECKINHLIKDKVS